MRTSELSNGERLTIDRRRANQSQREAAVGREVSLYRYRRWENDEDDPPRISIGKVEPHEACFIGRRRAGKPLQELAAELGVSRWWLTQMEYGRAPADRLIEYWASKGKPWRKASVAR